MGFRYQYGYHGNINQPITAIYVADSVTKMLIFATYMMNNQIISFVVSHSHTKLPRWLP